MLFTIAHVAAVLPLRHRLGLQTTPLVIGALVPDLALLTPVSDLPTATHSWLGIATVDLVLAAAAGLLWAGWLRLPVTALVPDLVWQRLHAPRRGRHARESRTSQLGWWAASAIMGAATHVAWDAAVNSAHRGRAQGDSTALMHLLGADGAAWAPLAAALMGCAVAATVLFRWILDTPAVQRPRPPAPRSWRRAGATALGGASAVGAVAALLYALVSDSSVSGARELGGLQLAEIASTGALGGVVVASLALGVMWSALARRSRARSLVDSPLAPVAVAVSAPAASQS